ncbi:ABC transporter ATP-binding protein [Thermogymnomonas acidicola]|uniref:ABC transporter ATP-binding protein n=1 Tax=Thermogymnomonas acidicola TaxID=399579 RepID=UPI00094624FE|nr:ABC transporter ATP-binding protein [Thermogymnomonas acidicola]
MSTKLELRNVTQRYGSKVVLNRLSLEIEDGEFFVILGPPSGTGKSTLLRTIVGIERPVSGHIILDGKDITQLPPNKRNIAMVFQNYALYPNMTVYENISFPLRMAHMNKQQIREKVTSIAKKLNIEEVLDRNVTQLSGGQKQRVALSRALVRNPAMFLLDEPLSNLDARVRFTAREELKKIQRDFNQTFVYVTHDQSEAQNLADRVAVLRNGRIEQIGKYNELYENPKTKWIGDFIGGDYPMNFLDGSVLGLDGGVEIGFRPYWVECDSGEIEGRVISFEIVHESYFVYCDVKGKTVVVRSTSPVESGDYIRFSIKKFRKYRDGNLVEDGL